MKKLFVFLLFLQIMIDSAAWAYVSNEKVEPYYRRPEHKQLVPTRLFSDYFVGRGYHFKTNPTQCPYALTIEGKEANQFAGTAVFYECRQGLFHFFHIYIYRNLPASRIKESLDDVEHLFEQAAYEKTGMDSFLRHCRNAEPGYQKVFDDEYYTAECSVSEDGYVFVLTHKAEHDHPPIKVPEDARCMTDEEYQEMVKGVLRKRAEFSDRMEAFYFIYPEEAPEGWEEQRKQELMKKYKQPPERSKYPDPYIYKHKRPKKKRPQPKEVHRPQFPVKLMEEDNDCLSDKTCTK